jgi:hypothetical protein
MSTDFNNRAAHDRPLNDRFSDVPSDEPEFDEPRADHKALDDERMVDDKDVDDERMVDDETLDDDRTVDGRALDDDRTVDGRALDDERRVDDKAVINDDEPVYEDTAAVDDEQPYAEQQQEPVVPQATAVPQDTAVSEQETRLRVFEEQETEQFRTQWREVQARFVDEPQSAVRDADSLLSTMMDELKSHIDSHKRSLDGEWDRDTKDTEQLRVAMQRYRSLFDHILSV